MLSAAFGLPYFAQQHIENLRLNIVANLLGLASHFDDFQSLAAEESKVSKPAWVGGLAPAPLDSILPGSTKVLEHARQY